MIIASQYAVLSKDRKTLVLPDDVQNWLKDESFAQLSFLVNSGHCEEQSDVAILWIINMF